jgi:uncharacterized protein (TIGR02996 family)
MSTEAHLLRAIRDNPDEDTPRLMYADHLDEEGSAARAEFIRVQDELARLSETDPKRPALEDREHELLAKHEYAWLGVDADDADELTGWVFERGFVNEVAASPLFMRRAGADLCATHPVRRWRVMSGQNNFPEDLKEAVRRGWAARLEAVDLTNWYPPLGEIRGFGAGSNFERLRELDLTGRGPLDALPGFIESAPFRDQLRVLRCGGTGYFGGRIDVSDFVKALGTNGRLEVLAVSGALLQDADVCDLLAGNALVSLKSLDLSDNPFGADAWDGFRAAHFRLRELDLSATALGRSGLDRLLGCAALADLNQLRLDRLIHTSVANVRALAASRFWSQAEELRMSFAVGLEEDLNPAVDEAPPEAGPVSLDPLFDVPGPKNLRVLNLAGNLIRDGGMARLCRAPWAGSLTYLDLLHNDISDDALRELVQSGCVKQLRALDLGFNIPEQPGSVGMQHPITDAGICALAECPDLANLRVLSLGGTSITAAGVEAVLNSPHWRLSRLSLPNCQLRPNVIDVLASSPRIARLESLDLSENDALSGRELLPLAESPYLSPRTALNATGIRCSAEVRDVLRQRLGRRFSD